jgi:3-hydroxyacyl-CoA dehydrogenase
MEHDLPLRVIDRVGVVGAGQMGSGIAASLVRVGIPTAIMDVSAPMLESAVKTVWKVAGEGPGERSERLATGTSPAILADCDVVIEAVTEDEAIKTATYRSVAGILREGAVLATNTSTIPFWGLA